MALINIPQPIPWYDAPNKRHWSKARCESTLDDVVSHNWRRIPVFVIKRDPSGFPPTQFRLYAADGSFTEIPTSNLAFYTDGEYEYIHTNSDDTFGFDCGRYYMRIIAGNLGQHTYYSEWFNLASPTGKTRLTWNDECKKLGIPYQELNNGSELLAFTFQMDTPIGEPQTTTEEEREDNGTQLVTTDLRTIKRYLLNDALPEYIVDCFHAMKYHDNVILTDGEGGSTTYASARVDTVTASYLKMGCVANTAVLLQLTDEWRSTCCDDLTGCEGEAVAELVFNPNGEDTLQAILTVSNDSTFTPVQIGWQVNGVPQGSITYTGTASYILGTVNVGDVVIATLINEQNCQQTFNSGYPCGEPTIVGITYEYTNCEMTPWNFVPFIEVEETADFPILDGVTILEVNDGVNGWQSGDTAEADGADVFSPGGLSSDDTWSMRLRNGTCVYEIEFTQPTVCIPEGG